MLLFCLLVAHTNHLHAEISLQNYCKMLLFFCYLLLLRISLHLICTIWEYEYEFECEFERRQRTRQICTTKQILMGRCYYFLLRFQHSLLFLFCLLFFVFFFFFSPRGWRKGKDNHMLLRLILFRIVPQYMAYIFIGTHCFSKTHISF